MLNTVRSKVVLGAAAMMLVFTALVNPLTATSAQAWGQGGTHCFPQGWVSGVSDRSHAVTYTYHRPQCGAVYVKVRYGPKCRNWTTYKWNRANYVGIWNNKTCGGAHWANSSYTFWT